MSTGLPITLQHTFPSHDNTKRWTWDGTTWTPLPLIDPEHDTRLRREALEQANRSAGEGWDTDGLLTRARAFYGFLVDQEKVEGGGEEETADTIDAAEPYIDVTRPAEATTISAGSVSLGRIPLTGEPQWFPPLPGLARRPAEPMLAWIDRVRDVAGPINVGLRESQLTQLFAELVRRPRPLTLTPATELPGLFYVELL